MTYKIKTKKSKAEFSSDIKGILKEKSKKQKFKEWDNSNYVKIYEKEDGTESVYLRKDIGVDNYFIGHIFYDKDGVGEKDIVLKRRLERQEGLKELTRIKKELEK